MDQLRPGPGSTTWRINGERLVVLAWPRAILLQLAHPLVAAGVGQHSTFRGSPTAPLQRLHGTISAMLALTFGSDGDARAAAERINRIHDRVHGTLSEAVGPYAAGTSYSAHDPALLAWVQITLLDSMPLVYQRLVAPLSRAELDAYCAEARAAAALLGVPADLLPASADGLDAIMHARLTDGTLAIGDQARTLAHAILAPPLGGLLGPARRIVYLVTAGLLPASIRDGYGLHWSPRDEADLARWTRRLRAFSSKAPAGLRRWRASRGPRRTATPVGRAKDVSSMW